jgi:subtilisin family serine protease
MWRRLALTNLAVVFFATNIIAFGAQKHGFFRLPAAPDEIIVKFKSAAATAPEELSSAGADAAQLELSGSLNKLNKKFHLSNIKPLFKNFKAHQNQIKALSKKNKSLLTQKEKRILQRLKRAPEKAAVPALDRIYKLQFTLGPHESIQDVLAAYNNDPNVEYAELNYIVSIGTEPDDPLYPLQWPLNNTGQDYPASGKYNLPPGTPDSDIDAPEAWDIHTGSPEVIIAVVDTGVDYEHRDLEGNIWINQIELNGMTGIDDDGNEYIDDIYGYDFVNHDNNPLDDNGHGTHCAGIIAAGGNNSLDIAGVCWNAKIMALKFLDKNGEGFSSDAAIAIYYAAENAADIISNSWAGSYPSETLEKVIDYAHSLGVIMVAAAANNNSDSPVYPAYYENMIAVAATNSKDQKATFSNYGYWVNIAAPGVDVLSLRAAGTSLGTIYDDYTTIASGTSMACPHVAAIIALIISNHPDTSTELIIERLFATTDDISTQNPGFDGLLGAGRANTYKAVRDGFEGIIMFDNNLYSCDDTAWIEVFDLDLITETTQPITITTEGGDLETVTLVSDPNTPWLFTGSISTSSDAIITEDGTLQLSHGKLITATYLDGDDGTGNPTATTVTATADCEGPQIFNVQVDVPGPEPIVTFQTNEQTTARVFCGLTCGQPYIIEAQSLILSDSHAVKLTGVVPKTDYFFIIEAVDAVQNTTLDDNVGNCFKFTTDEGPRNVYVPAEYNNIQEAIKRSWNGGTVWLADGIYKGFGNRDIDFLGRAITVRSENGPENCIVDCQGSVNVPHRGFYFHRKEEPNSIIVGLTITNAYAEYGGGICCEGSSPKLTDCYFRKNSAQIWGGAIYNLNSNPTLIDCTFSINSANWGGAIACHYCEPGPILVNCTLSNNSAKLGGAMYNDHSNPIVADSKFTSNSARYGGGMYNFTEAPNPLLRHPKITNCSFSNNVASSYGGGICNFESNPTVTGCEFSGNSARHYGGAMYNNEISSPMLDNCTLSINTANYGGAIYCLKPSRTSLTNCTVTGNSAKFNGGAILGCHGPVQNCTITNNTAEVGAGLLECYGPITNCIIFGNSATLRGGALYSCNGPIISCTITDNSPGALDLCSGAIVNCIIWNYDPCNSSADSILSVSSVPLYSCVQGGSDGIGCINIDPGFVDSENGDYHLLPNSPCKNAGNYYYCMNIPSTDRDGTTRMTGGQIDMGCYEIGSMPDLDGDWLDATQESLYGTHPNLPDTDGDGLADGVEILAGTNPLDADPPLKWQIPLDAHTIQQALFFSRPGETIILAEGTYYENIYLGGRNITLTGTEPNDFNVVSATIINGDTDNNPETMSGRVINLAGTKDTTCCIRGLTITGGSTNAKGGGIYGAGTRPKISNCIINNNSALDRGGGLYDCDGPIKNCAVTGNLAKDGGGFHYCEGPITNCTITENMANYRGGGLFDCGGEFICYGSNDCVFTITNCIVSKNLASSGAGMYNNLANPSLLSCTLSNNIASEFGGGVYNYASSPTFANCIFSGNSANNGGGIYNYENTYSILTNCTFADNSAPNGNAMACDSRDQIYLSFLQLVNCILWDGGDEIWNNNDSIIKLNYSNVQGNWPGVGNIDVNPMFADTNNSDYRLSADSPCIDAGIDAGIYEDIDGNIRPSNFPGVDNNGELPDFDMGAYESVVETQAKLTILPHTINRSPLSQTNMVVVHLPEPIHKDDIDIHEKLIIFPGAIEAAEQRLIPPGWEAQSNVRIHAIFDKAELLEVMPDDGDVEVIAIGRFVSGKFFYGTGTVRIISPNEDEAQ